MNKRVEWNYNKVLNFVAENSECILISDKYINTKSTLITGVFFLYPQYDNTEVTKWIKIYLVP